jgi:hypothetical protein
MVHTTLCLIFCANKLLCSGRDVSEKRTKTFFVLAANKC